MAPKRGDPDGDNLILLSLDASSDVPVIEQLRTALSKNMLKVLDIFKDWDDDENGMVSKTEFRKALPMLGLKVERSIAEELFDSFDNDKSGEIDYKELNQHLRSGADVELDAALQDGAAGEIEVGAKNAIDLRRQLSEQQKLEASALQGVALVAGDAGSVAEQLLKALDKNFMRIIDLFREWDDDDSGTVSKVEFRRALPCLGLRVERADADALFDSFDVDKSGTIDYKELHKAIKHQSLAASPVKSPRRPQRKAPDTLSSTAPLMGNWRQAVQEEEAARKKLLRLQKELENKMMAQAREAYKEQQRAGVTAMRADMAKRIGTDLTAKLADVAPASKEDVFKLSTMFNVQMIEILNGKQEWFLLFKAVDTDRSGRISYDELESMVRSVSGLQMSTKKLSTAKLQALWKALDEDSSGFLSTGEFGRFMKAGAQQAADHVAEKVAASKAKKLAEAQLQKRETEKLIGTDVTQKLADLPAATKQEVLEFSFQVNDAMQKIFLPQELESGWYRMFKKADADHSGRISITEFTEMVRHILKFDQEQLPPRKLKALWKGIDGDSSGWLSAGEFGRFCKAGAGGSRDRPNASEEEDASFFLLTDTMKKHQQKREKKRLGKMVAVQQTEATVLRLQTEAVEEQKRALEAEAARLEQALAEVKTGRRRRINFNGFTKKKGGASSVGASPRDGPALGLTEKAKPPKWTDPRPAVWARPQPAAPTPREPAGPSVAAAMERFRPMGQQAPRRSHQLVPADTRGKAWADPRPPPPRDLTQFAVPLAGF